MFDENVNENKTIYSSARMDGQDIFSVTLNYGARGIMLGIDIFNEKAFEENKEEAQHFVSAFISKNNAVLQENGYITIQPK